ncbi:hypothetical protein [Corynebacterium sp. HMSC074E01]|uniref:hypothetical protein n=1 Tax=Corynebacterium sp. HMSC074E01 TaxID=1715017 RepID=UPI0008A61F9D|nr:hypothetical protein [Corynebacterium sp. HMSC074E01]OFN78792.1 hypothetical protein HMPREF2537_00635 [Corynebacterium sp. HMSC074E01]
MRALELPDAREAVATRVRIECKPVREYDKEKKRFTDTQRTGADGRPLWEVEGVTPIVLGQVFEGGKVQVTQFFEPTTLRIGTEFVVTGDVETRLFASKGEIGCSMTGARLETPKQQAKQPQQEGEK